MKPDHSLRLLSVFMGLFIVTAVTIVAWPFVEPWIISTQNQIPLKELAWEHWKYFGSRFHAYLNWRWNPMIAVGYPYAFTFSVLSGVASFGAVLSLFRRDWFPLAQAVGAALIGGVIGWGVMLWASDFPILLRAFLMPGLVFVFGVVVPSSLVPLRFIKPVRGTHIRPYKMRSVSAVKKALQKGQVQLAGALLKPADEVRHIAAIGTTGSGKSVALQSMMYTAMRRGDRHIIADPDGGALALFGMEQDVTLNPSDARSAKWDLLGEIEEDTDYRLLAEAVVPLPRENLGSEWVTYAREIFSTCLETWHQNDVGPSDAFLEAMATANKEKLAQLCEGTAAHRYFESGNEKMLGSIMGTLAPALGNIRPLIRVQGAPFSIRRWVKEGKGCLWMPYQAKQIPALRGLISCWMGLAISETLSLPASETRRIWFHVDELDALGRIHGLKDALARLRKVGGCVVLGLQSIAQVRAVYGDAEANTIIENCHNKLILNCGTSERGGTAQFASDVIGDREVEREDITTSHGERSHGANSTSRSVRRQREPAVMNSEIMQLDPCTGYLKLASCKEWLRVVFQPIGFK